MFDSNKKGNIDKEKVRTILTTLGHTYDDSELDALLDGEDPQSEFPYMSMFIEILLYKKV